MGADELFDPDSYRDSSINPEKSGPASPIIELVKI